MEDFKSKLQGILDDETKLQAVSDKAFEKRDVDKSGYIEAKEFRKDIADMYAKFGKPKPTKAEVDEIMSQLDTNDDGKLDKEEYKEHTRRLLQGMVDGSLGK